LQKPKIYDMFLANPGIRNFIARRLADIRNFIGQFASLL